MRIRLNIIVSGFALVCLATAAAGYGQDKPSTGDSSLGDIARQLKAEKAKEPKAAKVITTDTITRSDMETSELSGSSKGKTSTDSTPVKESPKHDEAYYRAQMSSLQDKLSTHKRELDVMQQKLGQNQMQYYPDPNKTMKQEYSRGDIDKLTAEIDAKKEQIADDEKAIDDLRDQLRHEGGDPGWLR